MSNTQEQSLNENIVFAPLTEFNPDFLHCEEERYCVESLVSSGHEAFYTKLHQEQIGSFLSPGEVNQISGWAEDYHQSDANQEDGNGEMEVGSDGEDFSGHYFPTESDTPAPCLELGWPEKTIWMDMGQIHIYTNPPAEQMPTIREILRRHLQAATKLIAVVTDKLSDSTVIGDLQNAASRGVPVYIILNRRSVEENCFLHQLQHPNIMVRILGGKTYLTRDTKMVVGELKDNFVLVDLETVIFGSYSLSWSDAHLHRQLVTVISGRVVESFDREFRILYAASLPVPDAWKAGKPATEPKPFKKLKPLNINKVELAEFVSSPPPPPADRPLDWEAMGVIQRFPDSPLSPPEAAEVPFHHRHLLDRHPGRWEAPYNDLNSRLVQGYPEDGKFSSMFLSDIRHTEYQRPRRHYSPGDMHSNEVVNRPLQIPDRITYPLLNAEGEERFPVYKSRTHRMDITSEEELGASGRREPYLRRDRVLGDTMNPEGTTQANFKKPSELSRSKTFSTLSDILKRVNARASSSGQQRTDNPAPGVSKSTLDLNSQRSDTPSNARTTNCDNLPLTPALALMKKRNDEVKSGLLRSMPTVFTSGFRTPSFGLQRETWRSPFRNHRNEEEH
uniref:Family with sequence similarity 83 member E n=1 Tax=Cyprinus carpio carpio TaxID=630221 RepID=A0A9J8BXN5_CYPCA